MDKETGMCVEKSSSAILNTNKAHRAFNSKEGGKLWMYFITVV